MTVQERYEAARKMYADVGVDTDAAIAKLKEIPVSLHCWQGDDVTGFDHDGPLTGGIQTTGNFKIFYGFSNLWVIEQVGRNILKYPHGVIQTAGKYIILRL